MKERLAKVMTKKIVTLSWNVGEGRGGQFLVNRYSFGVHPTFFLNSLDMC